MGSHSSRRGGATAASQTPPRRLRSTALRHTRMPLADLTKRRTHFQRVAQHHINALRHIPPNAQPSPLSQLTPTSRRNRPTPSNSTPSDSTTARRSTDPNDDDEEDDDNEIQPDSNDDANQPPKRVSISPETAERALRLGEVNSKSSGKHPKHNSELLQQQQHNAVLLQLRELLFALKELPNHEIAKQNRDSATDDDSNDDENKTDTDKSMPDSATKSDKSQNEGQADDKDKDKDKDEDEDEDEDEGDIRGLAETMSTERFVRHESEDVRLVTACCLVEILRICAPDPPVDTRKLDDLCTLFIEQLSVLAAENDPMEALRFSLLEQLAVIKAFVLFCESEYVVCDLFACFYAIARPHHSQKVRQYFVDILSSVINEMVEDDDKDDNDDDDDVGNVNHDDRNRNGHASSKHHHHHHHVPIPIGTSKSKSSTGPGREVLDAILAPLVPALDYSPVAVAISERVVQATEKSISTSLCNLLNESIRSLRIDMNSYSASLLRLLPPSMTLASTLTSQSATTASSAAAAAAAISMPSTRRRNSPSKAKFDSDSNDVIGLTLSEHHPHMPDLVLTVSRLIPDVLIFVLPNLEPQIRSKDPAKRLGALQLAYRLFTSSVDMATSYPSLFMEFLARRGDMDFRVRQVVIASLGDLLLLQPKHASELEGMIFQRLFDRDERVRVIALRTSVRAADVLSVPTLERILTRLQDKAEVVRREAIMQCISLFTTVPKSKSGPNLITTTTIANPAVVSTSGVSSEDNTNNDKIKNMTTDSDAFDTKKTVISVSDFDERGERFERRLVRLSSIPNHMLSAYIIVRRARDHSLAIEFERGMFEKMLSLTCKPDDHVAMRRTLRRIALFLSFLEDKYLNFFMTVVAERARARALLLKIADLRLKGRASLAHGDHSQSASHSQSQSNSHALLLSPQAQSHASSLDKNLNHNMTKSPARTTSPSVTSKLTDGATLQQPQQQMSRGNIEEARQIAEQLAVYFPRSPNVMPDIVEYCCTVATAVDLKIYDRLTKALSCKTRSAEANEACTDAIARLGSKSKAGVFFSSEVLPKCRPGPFSSLVFSAMCDLAVSICRKTRNESDDPVGIKNDQNNDKVIHLDDERDRKPSIQINDNVIPMSEQLTPRVMLGIIRFFNIIGPNFRDTLSANMSHIIRMLTLPIAAHDWSAEIVLTALKLACNLPSRILAAIFDIPEVATVIKQLLLGQHPRRIRHGTKLAKWATRLLIIMLSIPQPQPQQQKQQQQQFQKLSHLPSIEEVGKLATNALDAFNGDLSSLIGPLAVIVQLAKRASTAFSTISLKCFDFSRVLLTGMLNKQIEAWVLKMDSDKVTPSGHGGDDTDYGSETNPDSVMSPVFLDIVKTLGRVHSEALYVTIYNDARLCIAAVADRACKILVHSLSHVDISEEFERVMDTLVKIVNENSGDVFGICNIYDGNNGSFTADRDGTKSDATNHKEIKDENVKMNEDSDDDDEIQPQFKVNSEPMDEVNSESTADKFTLFSQVNRVMCAAIRLGAARSLLFIARNEKLFRKISPLTMVSIMLMAQDEHPLGRLFFARVVLMSVLRKGLPLRWIVCLALMAVDPERGNRREVRALLVRALQHRRKLCERMRQTGRSRYIEMLPEATIADLMWVLANLPEVELEEEAGFPECTKCIELLLECLMESKEYANVLNEYIETVAISRDATDPDDKYLDQGQDDVGSSNVANDNGDEDRRKRRKTTNATTITATTTTSEENSHQNHNHISTRSDRLRELSRIASEQLRKKMAGRKWDLMEQIPRLRLRPDMFHVVAAQRRVDTSSGASLLRPAMLDVAKRYDRRKGIHRLSTTPVGAGGGGGAGGAASASTGINAVEENTHNVTVDKGTTATTQLGETTPSSARKRRGRPRKDPPDENELKFPGENGHNGKLSRPRRGGRITRAMKQTTHSEIESATSRDESVIKPSDDDNNGNNDDVEMVPHEDDEKGIADNKKVDEEMIGDQKKSKRKDKDKQDKDKDKDISEKKDKERENDDDEVTAVVSKVTRTEKKDEKEKRDVTNVTKKNGKKQDEETKNETAADFKNKDDKEKSVKSRNMSKGIESKDISSKNVQSKDLKSKSAKSKDIKSKQGEPNQSKEESTAKNDKSMTEKQVDDKLNGNRSKVKLKNDEAKKKKATTSTSSESSGEKRTSAEMKSDVGSPAPKRPRRNVKATPAKATRSEGITLRRSGRTRKKNW